MVCSSSPLSTPPTSQTTVKAVKNTSVKRPYRPARTIPFELAQHVQIYLEEQLFTQAFNFLTTLVSSGAASTDLTTPTLIPSNAHLAIAATLAVHPSLTSRTTSKERWQQSNAALRLIRLCNKLCGPVNSDFYHAFAFTKYNNRTSRGGGWNISNGPEESEDAEKMINSPYAGAESIWSRAEDFWQVVGWALNCSCLDGMHAVRWEHWSTWLETTIQILEDDWELRFAGQKWEESLMWQYVELASGGNGKYRRILRAIFADGSIKSLNEFKEIFRNELREPTPEADKVKKREGNVNIEAEIYGDYMARDDDDPSDGDNTTTRSKRPRTRTPSTRRLTPRTSASSLRSNTSAPSTDDTQPTTPPTLGPPTSITLRLRLLHLLSHLAGAIPESFLELDELYTLFVEFIRPLPLPVFQQLTSPSVHLDTFSPDAQTTLSEFLLQRMLESAAPTEHAEPYLTQRKWETGYAPWAATKPDVATNAKVALLVEGLLRSLWSARKLRKTDTLLTAVTTGVQRRTSRVAETAGRKKTTANEEEAWNWLLESGERMLRLVTELL